MTEQVMGVVSAEADPETQRIAPTGTLGAETSGSSSEQQEVKWNIIRRAGKERVIGASLKSLTERFNKAYDEEARREDEEFVKNLKRYHRRRFSDEW
jgi:hypothetical protein